MTTRTNLALLDHAEKTMTDARAVESHINKLLVWPHWPGVIDDINAEHVNHWIRVQGTALAPSTIQTRLSVLKMAMRRAGVPWPLDVKMPQRSKRPKWVLSEWAQHELTTQLVIPYGPFAMNDALAHLMADYIELVTETGLRVEEVLRIESRHLVYTGLAMTVADALAEADSGRKPTLEVIGTKNAASYDLIPLSKKAHELLRRRIALVGARGPLFPISYEKLQDLWMDCRTFLGVTDETATLKSLRRTFAARMATKGCPAPILQKLMRHGSLATTSHYTNTIGMHEAARQWVA